MTDDEAADGRRENDIGSERFKAPRQSFSREGGESGETKQQGTLKIVGAVKPRSEAEMALKMGTAFAEHFLKTLYFRQLRQDNPSSISIRIS